MKRLLAFLMICTMLLSLAMPVGADTAWPGPSASRQPTGELIWYTSHGDESWNGDYSGGYEITGWGYDYTYSPNVTLVYEIEWDHKDGWWYYATKSEQYRLCALTSGGMETSITFDTYDPTDPEYIAFMEKYPDAYGYYLRECSAYKFLIDVPDEVYLNTTSYLDSTMYVLSEAEKEDIRRMNTYAAEELATTRTANPGVAAMWDLVETLPAYANITLADEQIIADARSMYDALSDEEKNIASTSVRYKIEFAENRIRYLKNYEQNLPGDADYDGKVDVSDIMNIKNCIMGKVGNTLTLREADVNKDGKIDVADILTVKNIIMTQEASQIT